MSEVFTVKLRDKTGTNVSRQLRKQNQTPAVLYGLSQGSVAVAVPTAEINSAIRHGSHLIDLKGDLNEPALIKEVQWDALGSEVKHLDLERVDLSKNVEITLPLEIHGVAPGASNGGIVNLQVHELELSCPATAIPDHLEVNINHLEVDQEMLAKEVELPEGAELLGEDAGEIVVVTCNMAVAEDETEDTGDGVAEPEVIGEKADDAEGGE